MILKSLDVFGKCYKTVVMTFYDYKYLFVKVTEKTQKVSHQDLIVQHIRKPNILKETKELFLLAIFL